MVALILGGGFWMRKLTGIDTSKESVLVADIATDVAWVDEQWREVTGVHGSTGPHTSTNWNGGGNLKIHQTLLTLKYRNFFGQEVYEARVFLDGHHTSDWKNFIIHPYVVGGGILDGGTTVYCSFAPDASTLKLEVTQFFNNEMRAKYLELDFVRTGDTFVQKISLPK